MTALTSKRTRRGALKLTGAYISNEKHTALAALAKANHRTLAQQVRRIFDEALANPDSVPAAKPKSKPAHAVINWITDGSLPPRGEVLVACKQGGVGAGYYSGGVWFWDSTGRIHDAVVAWAKMPPPPTQQEGRAA